MIYLNLSYPAKKFTVVEHSNINFEKKKTIFPANNSSAIFCNYNLVDLQFEDSGGFMQVHLMVLLVQKY